MDKIGKCKICGCAAITVIILNSYPVCRDCFIKLREYPDMPSHDKSIESPTKASYNTIFVNISASSTSTTTTQPPILD